MSINVVISRYHNPVDWVYRLTGINQIFIYEKENPDSPYNVPVNKGNEASVFLHLFSFKTPIFTSYEMKSLINNSS